MHASALLFIDLPRTVSFSLIHVVPCYHHLSLNKSSSFFVRTTEGWTLGKVKEMKIEGSWTRKCPLKLNPFLVVFSSKLGRLQEPSGKEEGIVSHYQAFRYEKVEKIAHKVSIRHISYNQKFNHPRSQTYYFVEPKTHGVDWVVRCQTKGS